MVFAKSVRSLASFAERERGLTSKTAMPAFNASLVSECWVSGSESMRTALTTWDVANRSDDESKMNGLTSVDVDADDDDAELFAADGPLGNALVGDKVETGLTGAADVDGVGVADLEILSPKKVRAKVCTSSVVAS